MELTSAICSNRPHIGWERQPDVPKPMSPQGGVGANRRNSGQAIGWQELLPQSREEAQLLQRGTAGERVHIPDWTEFLALFDQAVQRRIKKAQWG